MTRLHRETNPFDREMEPGREHLAACSAYSNEHGPGADCEEGQRLGLRTGLVRTVMPGAVRELASDLTGQMSLGLASGAQDAEQLATLVVQAKLVHRQPASTPQPSSTSRLAAPTTPRR